MSEYFDIKPHHCGLSVPDLEASIKWYSDILGFTLAKRLNIGNGEIAFMKMGDFYIELFGIPGSRPSDDLSSPRGQDLKIQGTKHMAFQVKDLPGFVEYLSKRGIQAAGPARPSTGSERPSAELSHEERPKRALFIRDNAGILLEFVPITAPE